MRSLSTPETRSTMADAKLFARGKTQELRAELQQADIKKDKGFLRKKTALKKVVANMTMGNDSECQLCGWLAFHADDMLSVLALPRYYPMYDHPSARDQKE